MLRSPLEALGEQPATTAAAILALAAWLWMAAASATVYLQLKPTADAWFERSAPVVYLQPGAAEADIDELAREIEQWSQVEHTEFRSSEELLEALEERIGEEDTAALGIDGTVMPSGLVVVPRIWWADGVEFGERLETLVDRQSVVGIDAPEGRFVEWLRRGRTASVAVAICVVVGLAATLVMFGAVLRRMQRREWREKHLLEVFGASPASLKRATLVRGTAVGLAAGLVGATGYLPWTLIVDEMAVGVAGAGELSPVEAAAGAVGIAAVGLVIGVAAGWLCRGATKETDERAMKSLLTWERR